MGAFSEIDLTESPIEAARQARLASRLPLLDLTCTNPTKQGLLFPKDVLKKVFEEFADRRIYEPAARGLIEARSAICGYYNERSPALPLTPDNIFITAGTSEAYSLLFSVLADPGDILLSPSPSYPLFDLLAAAQRLELRFYPLVEEQGWKIDERALSLQKSERCKAVLIVSPHNPTGAVHGERLEAIPSLGVPVISDEVFAAFSRQAPPLGALYPDVPVFHLGGISKMLGLPDMKLAWIAANDRALKAYGKRLELLNDSFLSCSAWVQSALPVLLKKSGEFQRQMIERVNGNMERALGTLNQMKGVSARRPEGAYFILPSLTRVKAEEEEALVIRLIEEGLYVHPGYFFGLDGGPARLCISCLLKPEVLDEGLRILARVLAG